MNWKRLLLSAGLLVAAGPVARAQGPDDTGADMEAQARALVETVLGGAQEDIKDLAGWANAVIGDTLAVTDPADSGPDTDEYRRPMQGGAFAPAQAGTTEVIVFASLSMPEESWRQWSRQASRLGTPLVLRGIAGAGFAATVQRIAERRPEDGAGAAVDPRLFRLFRIAHVPAVAVVPGGVPPCTSPGCSAEAPPPFDLVTGNIGLEAALEAIAGESGPGRDTARRHLQRLRGESH